MTYLYQTADEALVALKEKITGLDWKNNPADRDLIKKAIHEVVNHTSVQAEGKTTVLYSGQVNGSNSFEIADKMKNDPNIRVLDKTPAFALLKNEEFNDILAKSFGYNNSTTMETILDSKYSEGSPAYYSSPEKFFNGDSKSGLWAMISKNFAKETVGAVRIMTENPRVNSVLIDTEIPELLKNPNITTINNIDISEIKHLPNAVSNIVATSSSISSLGELNSNSYEKWFKLDTQNAVKTAYANADEKIRIKISEDLNSINNKFGSYTAYKKFIPGNKTFLLLTLLAKRAEAKQAEEMGDIEGAKNIWIEFFVGELGAELSASFAGLGLRTLTSAALFGLSAPVATVAGIVIGIIAGVYGEEYAVELYRLTKDLDNNGRMDLIDRIANVVFPPSIPVKDIPEALKNNAIKLSSDFKINELIELAKSDIAYRYALRELNPFVAVGADYTEFNQDGSLNLLDENNQNGMSDAYIEDRSKMLILQLLYFKNGKKLNRDLSSDDLNIDWSKIGDFDYIDYSILPFAGGSKDPLVLSVDGEGLIYDNQIIAFASNEGGKIKGSNKADRMYGKSGADEFDGGKGNDYFEGGTGFDTYHIEGHDIVFDIDGLGLLYKNNGEETITDTFDIFSEGIWKTKDQKQTAFKKGNNLEIIEDDDENTKVTIYNFFNTAKEMGNYWHSLGIHIEKPKEESLLDYEFPEHDMQIGASNKNNTFYGSGEYVWYQGGNKTDRVISSLKEGMIAELGNGSDLFLGNVKKDIAWGDGGKDVLIGSNRNEENIDDPDYLEGGEDKDLINGGSGNDVLYGDNPDLISYTKTNPAISYDFSDWIVGGFGDDKIFGSAGKDILVGGGHKDIIFGGAGADLILGDAQLLFDYKHIIPAIVSDIPVTNEFTFDSKAKTWFADKSKGFYHFKIKEESFDWSFDIKYNEEKTDYEIISEYKLKEDTPIDPKGDTDYLYGGEGDDLMLGQKGNDFMFGEDGDDIMFGDDNRDLSLSGHDYMSGGTGNNQLFGGKGNDTYIITANSQNTINDIEGTDAIDLSGYHSSAFQFNYSGGSLFIFSQLNNISVEIKNWLNNGIEKFRFKDGTLEPEDIQKLANQDNNQPLNYPIDPSLYNHPNDDFV